MTQNKSPQIIKADTSLQKKAGTGSISQNVVDKAEAVMQNTNVDFAPMASGYLKELAQAISQCRLDKYNSKEEAIAAVTTPVMQLKANSKTFGYGLVGDMANIMLSFMETIKEVDRDVIAILNAHHKTLNAIIIKQMKGDGGEYGKQMKDELQGACQRYLKRLN